MVFDNLFMRSRLDDAELTESVGTRYDFDCSKKVKFSRDALKFVTFWLQQEREEPKKWTADKTSQSGEIQCTMQGIPPLSQLCAQRIAADLFFSCAR